MIVNVGHCWTTWGCVAICCSSCVNPASCEIQQFILFSMVQEDGAVCGSSAASRTQAEGENSRQVAAHETPLPTPPEASSTATEGEVVTKDEKRKKAPPPPFPPLLVAQQSQQVETARQSKRPRTEDNAFQRRLLPCVCWDTLDQSSWYNVLKFVAPAPPENIFMNLYVQGSLHNDSLHDAGMPRPLRGHLKHGGRSAFVCEGQLPLLGSFDMTVGRLVREDYFIWIKDNSGIVRATMLWNQHRICTRVCMEYYRI